MNNEATGGYFAHCRKCTHLGDLNADGVCELCVENAAAAQARDAWQALALVVLALGAAVGISWGLASYITPGILWLQGWSA